MTIIISVILVSLLSYCFSDFIKKYRTYLYLVFTAISITAIIHALYMVNGYSIKYVAGLSQFMKAIDSGALGGAFFILVMYMGVFDMKYKFAKRLRRNRAELSILATIITLPHNTHYFFAFIKGQMNVTSSQGLTLWTNLMMFASAVFAISIMIPLFITSFNFFKKKMGGKAWKNLQEYAYIFYAMIFIQVICLYINKPWGLVRNINLIFYILVFSSYSILKIKLILNKKRAKQLKAVKS